MSRRRSFVDLTSTSGRRSSVASLVPPSSPPSALNRRTEEHSSPPIMPRGTKRRRGDDGPWAPSHPSSPGESIESVDLTELDNSSSLAKTLAKQREDAVKSQQATGQEKLQSVLGAYKCPVCMDTPEDATSTACGHLFCHRCIVECLNRASDQHFDSNKQIKGTCPVCRKALTRNEASGPRRSLVPLQLKLMTKKQTVESPARA